MHRRPMRALAALGMLALCACSRDALAPLRSARVELDLLTAQELRSVELEHPDLPVHVRLFRSSTGADDLLPGLEMAPPARVRYRIPPMPAGALLELAPCADWKSRALLGTVHLRASLDGAIILETAVAPAAILEQAAHPVLVPIERGGVLELTSEYDGSADRGPFVGFSGLSIRVPFEHERFPAVPKFPNVVLILVDTLRADRLHAYGNPLEVSPVIDALAARGLLFEEAYSDSSWTIPSTVSVLTGVSSIRHGVRGQATQFMTEGHVSLAERFLDYGVETAAFSCNPLVSPGVNFDQGFQEYRTYTWKSAAEIMSDVVAWLGARDGGRFFLYLHLIDPHDPYHPDPAQVKRFAKQPPEGWKEASQQALATRLEAAPSTAAPELADHVAYNLDLYDAEIASLDAALGELFATLSKRGLLDRTVIALTSDHGEEFLEHGLVGHSMQLHEECVHVPLILAGPGVQVGRREVGLVSNVHLGATLLRLARIDRGGFLGQRDLVDEALAGGAVHYSTVRGMVYEPSTERWLHAGELFGMRAAHWQLHWSASSAEHAAEIVRLWDLESDPGARHDVAAEHPEVVVGLRQELARWISEAKSDASTTLSEGDAEAERLRAAGYAGGDGNDGGD